LSREIRGLKLEGAYLRVEEWDIRWRRYQLHNRTAQPLRVLVEHPRTAHYDLVDTAAPLEQTDQHLRFAVEAPARAEAVLQVCERRLVARHEEIQKQSHQALQRYLQKGLIDREAYDQVAHLLGLYEKVAEARGRLQEVDQQRETIYKAQQQVQGNMAALSTTGKEGALRARYVEQLEASEEELKGLARQEAELRAAIAGLEQEIQKLLTR
jgi:uncharacterized protein YukE